MTSSLGKTTKQKWYGAAIYVNSETGKIMQDLPVWYTQPTFYDAADKWEGTPAVKGAVWYFVEGWFDEED